MTNQVTFKTVMAPNQQPQSQICIQHWFSDLYKALVKYNISALEFVKA